MEVIVWHLSEVEEDILNLAQAAKVLDVQTATAKSYCEKHGIPHSNFGGQYRIPRESLIHWMNSKSQGLTYRDPGFQGKYLTEAELLQLKLEADEAADKNYLAMKKLTGKKESK